jgi:hypothetical protein
MRNDKHLAIELRRRNKSYNKISKELGVPKSTLSKWFSKIGWSQNIKNELARKANYVAKKRLRLINKTRRVMWERWREKARQQAKKEFPYLKRNHLFLAGLMLYWGEGDSKVENSLVRLSNTDSEMIRIFSLFLQNSCKVPRDKIKATLILYPDLNENKCKDFWSKSSGIPKNKFYKTQVIYGRHPTKRLSYGICNIYVASRELKEKVLVWIKLYQQELVRV